MKRCQPKAFTLIELLIVVAIIAILAAIAIPNFLEAQTRAKVARTKADMRTVAMAVHAYTVDYNTHKFPPGGGWNNFWIQITYTSPPYRAGQVLANCAKYLTTPIAYLTTIPMDIQAPWQNSWASFSWVWYATGIDTISDIFTKRNFSGMDNRPYGAYLAGLGGIGSRQFKWFINSVGPDRDQWIQEVYDPTNGTISAGDMYYFDTVGLQPRN